ncbi:aldehyde dehydrogenase [Talaromyces proteolyticus]|uniref:aldehyde dehydrogenase (NAD(+)) n=1 Tax=Talaromyces proteolyticus TaxID=1131652 RepID=A0AAD4KW56_9EURO|nr:aldehyde dehydrogenase [Talaromyces proteolyticus]KAH8701095.1 aldehyde dehydrogenase [Talaromyces proteolyticus]
MTALEFTQFYNVIDGRLETTVETTHGINPSTLEPNPKVPLASEVDVNRAVAAARMAFDLWSEKPLDERRQALIAFADSLAENKGAFARMLTIEQGKPLNQAEVEVDASVKWLKQQATLSFPEDVIVDTEEQRVTTSYTPIGIAAAIVPWNFPLMLACGKLAPALLTGNALILKPSPFTPYCGLKLAELGQRHFPPGVLQALSGDDSLGPILTEHPDIDKISFTGSTATGKRVMESCSRTLKRLTLELGGNDPAIVCEDVNLMTVVPQIVQYVWANSGQLCVAIKRIYVHSSIYPQFLDAFVKMTKSLVVGDGFGASHLGPVQNKAQYTRVQSFLDNIGKTDCTVVAGGDFTNENRPGPGYFFTPTVVDNPPDDSMVVTEEPFGPVIPILQWTSEDEVIRRANNSDYGLGASVWTKDTERASRISKKLKAGTVWINSHMLLNPLAPFGGHKKSGLGAEWGVEGLKSYCNTQTFFWTKKPN